MNRGRNSGRPGGSESFERYYLRNVAINEGCGCAEQVIRRGLGEDGPRRPGGSLLLAALGLLARLFRTGVKRRP